MPDDEELLRARMLVRIGGGLVAHVLPKITLGVRQEGKFVKAICGASGVNKLPQDAKGHRLPLCGKCRAIIETGG